ncbi:hypothetical protein D3C75_1208140 [compost metagenome]
MNEAPDESSHQSQQTAHPIAITEAQVQVLLQKLHAAAVHQTIDVDNAAQNLSTQSALPVP